VEHKEEVKKITKKQLAKQLGVSRSSLYYKKKRDVIDEKIKKEIIDVLKDNPAYGHKRIALFLRRDKKQVLRVMKKYGIKPYRRRGKKPVKKDDQGREEIGIENYIKTFCPIKPNIVWVSDFTYIKYQGKFFYVATIMDVFTREIIGIAIDINHTMMLVLDALKDAIKRIKAVPVYLHMDQGSEYTAEDFMNFSTGQGIQLSFSKKASPWENGFQESFYSGFKLDLGFVDRFESAAELIETIYLTIHYYNNKRIHTKLNMSPVEFKYQYAQKVLDFVS